MDVKTGKMLRYAILPGIIPRIMDFFTSGFSHIALYLAYVYRTVRLLPAGHPYLNPVNIGQYGIRHVIFEARRNLVFKKENADQVIIFFTILLGIVLLFLQFAFLIAGFMIPAANAGLGDEIGDYVFLSNFFSITPAAATYDIAYRLMDLTFGFKNPSYTIFNSCAVQGVECQLAFTPGGGFVAVGPTYSVPTQFHRALHTLFHFYNVGILVVGFMVMMYMFATVVAETAQSGTPFGKRFNRLWAPIRLIIAIALLTPLAFGLNGAQLLTLMMAKWGSNMATNAWQEFMFDINGFGTTLLGDPATLVARPNAPPVNNLIEMTFVALTCRSAEQLLNKRDDVTNPQVKAWLIYGKDQSIEFVPTAFAAALSNAINGDPDTNNGDIIVRFGPKDPVQYERYSGHVKPLCGEITFQTKDIHQPGARDIQEFYYEMVKDMWTDALQISYANNIALRYMPVATRDPYALLPDNAYVESTISHFNPTPADIDAARLAQIGATWNEDFTTLGWAGAAIWYQKIAEYTGGFFAAVNGVPTPNLYPAVMEHVRDQRRMHDDFTAGLDRFDPVMSGGNMVEFENAQDTRMAAAYFYAQSFWNVQYKETGGSSMLDSVIAMFGLSGLINIHKNLDIHPLAQLVGIGRSLIESAVTNLGFSFGAGVVGGLANILGKNLVESVAMAAASFAGQIALIGLALGFILYYIVPFLPFIYFFFAVGGWIKGIFEAMVGLPLWALAHVRIDGEGLPGPAAMNGYFLIFEIFLRPLLIIFGLLAGIIIFASQVQVLNEIWQLVTSNLLGFDSDDLGASIVAGTGAGVGPTVGSIEYLRNAADRLFYTVIYAIIVYMMAMASFKLVDLIPNNILRWMNASVSTFGEQSGDPAASLVQYSFMGSQLALGPMNSAMQGIAARAAPKI